MLKETLPTAKVIGVAFVICGAGFCRVTVVLPDLLESEVSAAAMVMELLAGGNSGATYCPVALMMPVAAEPPATPLTDQVSAGVEPSLVVAVNCCEAVPRMVIFDGETVNVKPETPPPVSWMYCAQPERPIAATSSGRAGAVRFTEVSPVKTESRKEPNVAGLCYVTLATGWTGRVRIVSKGKTDY